MGAKDGTNEWVTVKALHRTHQRNNRMGGVRRESAAHRRRPFGASCPPVPRNRNPNPYADMIELLAFSRQGKEEELYDPSLKRDGRLVGERGNGLPYDPRKSQPRRETVSGKADRNDRVRIHMQGELSLACGGESSGRQSTHGYSTRCSNAPRVTVGLLGSSCVEGPKRNLRPAKSG